MYAIRSYYANEFGWVVPDETLTITVYAGEGDQEEFLV